MRKLFHISDEGETGNDAFVGLIEAETYEEAIAWLVDHTQISDNDLENGDVQLHEVIYHYKTG